MKNAAYAWRQRGFFLSLIPKSEPEDFARWAQQRLDAQPRDTSRARSHQRRRLLAAIQEQVAPRPGRMFLGWRVDAHWLLKPAR